MVREFRQLVLALDDELGLKGTPDSATAASARANLPMVLPVEDVPSRSADPERCALLSEPVTDCYAHARAQTKPRLWQRDDRMRATDAAELRDGEGDIVPRYVFQHLRAQHRVEFVFATREVADVAHPIDAQGLVNIDSGDM